MLVMLMVAGAVDDRYSLFAADAWNNITFTAGEVKNPAPTCRLAWPSAPARSSSCICWPTSLTWPYCRLKRRLLSWQSRIGQRQPADRGQRPPQEKRRR